MFVFLKIVSISKQHDKIMYTYILKTVLVILFAISFGKGIESYWPPPYQYAEKYFDHMPVDHFSFDRDNETFSMRYLINDTFYDPKDGPIFFYCGNEGDITIFANNTVSGFLISNFL